MFQIYFRIGLAYIISSTHKHISTRVNCPAQLNIPNLVNMVSLWALVGWNQALHDCYIRCVNVIVTVVCMYVPRGATVALPDLAKLQYWLLYYTPAHSPFLSSSLSLSVSLSWTVFFKKKRMMIAFVALSWCIRSQVVMTVHSQSVAELVNMKIKFSQQVIVLW